VPASIATRVPDLRRAQREQTLAAFPACEGGEFPEGRPEAVDVLYADGVRSLRRVHYMQNDLGDLQTQPAQNHGLSTTGKAVVRRMNAVGIVVDVAHASHDTVRDVVSLTSAPILLSHSLPKADDSRPLSARTITEEHARLIAGAGGIVGAWPSGFNSSYADFVENTKRLIDVAGIDHAGLGTDIDGTFKPVFGSYEQLADWTTALRDRGFSASDLKKLLDDDVQRVLQKVIG